MLKLIKEVNNYDIFIRMKAKKALESQESTPTRIVNKLFSLVLRRKKCLFLSHKHFIVTSK